MSKIKLYDTKTFIKKFMPSDELHALFHGDYGKFLIVKLQEMYKHVSKPVPATRATNHICIFITKGEAVMKVGSETYKIQKNEILFVPAGQVFSFEEYDISKFNKGYLCNFHNDMLMGRFGKADILKDFEFLNIWGNPLIKFDKKNSKYVIQIFKRLLFDYARYGLQHSDLIQSYLITLFCEVKNVYQPLSNSNKISAVGITNKFKELIFTNIKTKHLVTDYASLLNISPNHLNKSVRSITSKSPTKWIDEALILEAKILLTQSDLSVSEISFEIGFEDPSYFSRFFRRYEGLTPSEFRKTIEISSN